MSCFYDRGGVFAISFFPKVKICTMKVFRMFSLKNGKHFFMISDLFHLNFFDIENTVQEEKPSTQLKS